MAQAKQQGRALIIVQNLSVPFDRRVWLECQTLVAAGYGVSVICPKGPGDPSYQLLEGVHLHKYRPAPVARGAFGYALEFLWCWVLTARLSLKVLARHGFDVIQTCNPPDTYWALAIPYKLLGKRFVYDQHDLCPEVYASRFGGDASSLLLGGLRLLEKATYRTADHVISTNSSYRKMAMTRGRKAPEAVTIVRSGPDTSRMKPAKKEPELANGRRYLACYLGVMGPQDGVELLLRAWSILVHDLGRDDCHLALLGFGDCYEDLVRQSVDLGLSDFVTFTGRADGELISRYLSSADIGVCPDPHSPLNDVSTMNKTMEYMAFGLPLVSFDLAESVVSGGDAAVFVAGDDVEAFAAAVVDLLDDPEQRWDLGVRARRRAVGVLDWRMQAAEYVGVYDRLLGLPDRHIIVLPDSESAGRFVALADRRQQDRRVGAARPFTGTVRSDDRSPSGERRAEPIAV
jgi:glycosyltransferase involved in cell wall biosynthesis